MANVIVFWTQDPTLICNTAHVVKYVCFKISIYFTLEANKDSKEEEKTEKTVEKMKKEGPSSSEKVDKMCKFIYSRDTSD